MKKPQRRQQGKAAFDLIEEATHLLRTAPAATLAVYFLGTIPFVLGLLFFWADMSRSPLAPQHLAEASLGMAALFLWMKFWQAVFARRLRAQAAGQAFPALTFRGCLRIFSTQAIVQPLGLFVLPVAIIPVLAFPWAYAFYQNATVLDDGAETGPGVLVKNARKQTRLWPRQNHLLLVVMLAFALCVFLNWATICLTLPSLCKMLFGIESDFTKSPQAMLNSTFFAAMAGLTYLCVDPIFKTIYTLRCFYGESLLSGEDLKAELKPFVDSALKTAATLSILVAIFSASPAWAESTNAPASSSIIQTVSPAELDHAINQTIHERKYVWRMPREQVIAPDSHQGVFAGFFEKMGEMIREWARDLRDWLEKIWDKLFRDRPAGHVQSDSSGYGWIVSLHFLLYGLVVAAVAALAIFLYRVWRARRLPAPPVASAAIQPAPDIADENVGADQLPEDGWTKLARELLERGEFRLAMRAFYLAGLAHLAARNLISLARFKSNRDYERELRRRGHAFPDLPIIFGNNIPVFERCWYGMHEASRELVDQFAANLERLKGNG